MQSPLRNQILAALPVDVRSRIFPHLKLTRLPLGKVLYEAGHTLKSAYFPTDSIVSLLYTMNNGASGEISVVGNEGIVGVSLFMGGGSTSSRAVVQSAGHAYRLLGTTLLKEFASHAEVTRLLLSYTQSLITQMTQTAACNKHHSIDEQMARWLLLSLDRLSGHKMKMTRQLISNMLSVSGARVDEVASRLQRLGVIRYRDGHIDVVNRPALENLSCECYAVVKGESDRLSRRVVGQVSALGRPRKHPLVIRTARR